MCLFKQLFNIQFVGGIMCLVMQNWRVSSLCMKLVLALSFFVIQTNSFFFLIRVDTLSKNIQIPNVCLFKQSFNIGFVGSITCSVACLSLCMKLVLALSFFVIQTNSFFFLIRVDTLSKNIQIPNVCLFKQSFNIGFVGSITCSVMQNWPVFQSS